MASWIDRREVQSEKANLLILFEKYVPVLLDASRSGRFKKITPIEEVSMIQTLCYLMEALLTPKNTPPDSPKDVYELFFVFAAIWAFGGFLFQDQLVDYRVEFSKWWVTEFKHIKFPSQGTIFDYFLDCETLKWVSWSEKVSSFTLDPEVPLQAVMVPTTETVRFRYFVDLLMGNQRPVMLVGNAGCGKTVLVTDKLAGRHQLAWSPGLGRTGDLQARDRSHATAIGFRNLEFECSVFNAFVWIIWEEVWH